MPALMCFDITQTTQTLTRDKKNKTICIKWLRVNVVREVDVCILEEREKGICCFGGVSEKEGVVC